jgi:thiamine pyrophosphokinase
MLRFWGQKASILIAADRGGDLLIAAGLFPHVVLGDFDSSSLALESQDFDIHRFEDQDYSDCDKLLSYIEAQGYPEATIIGFEGDRIDHVLASLGSFLHSPVKVRIAIRHGLAHVQKGRMEAYSSFAGQTVSLLPILACEGVTTTGLQWPLSSAPLQLGGALSLSNLATGDRFTVAFDSGALLVVQEFDEARLPEW